MRQRSFAVSTRTSIGVSSGKVESQYLVGSRSSSGHSQQPFERLWGRELAVSRGGPYPHGGEARGQGLVGALTPGHVSPGFFRQRRRQRLGRDRPMIGVAPR